MFKNYKLDELVEIAGLCSNFYPRIRKTAVGYIDNTRPSVNSVIQLIVKIDTNGYKRLCSFESVEKIERKDCIMNEIIVEMFPATKDAILVDKHFGREIDKPIFKMLIKGKESELLEEAKRLEAAIKK